MNEDEIRDACSTHGEMRNAYTNLMGKHEEIAPLVRRRCS
jgi:hypothetical protein